MTKLQLPSPREYAPGERVPLPGVYRVIHEEHRPMHLVSAMKGDEFPVCRKCKRAVRFQLWMEVEYLTRDWDLAGPSPQWFEAHSL